ncbi:inactive non-canonical poly(a) RNA polymerase protein trf4-2-related [Anaeramoeba flamelloides]|uniref:Inactive non-canonical poly(A) RNA polymerase protein trf4-2-related n=1 Tax=Anaeramoeba flamelloides TaxID=1746091 RepID=A0ABQ8Z962_9EUKA|nr:inactive non-canonical poly(a) RNA polymerase protein trf4-2-related [Anaeramoeba flamelloides]
MNRNEQNLEFESLPSSPVESAYNKKEFATRKKYYMELYKKVKTKFITKNFNNPLYQNHKVYKPKYHYFHENRSYCLHAEIIDFVKWISPTEKSKQVRLDLITRIKKAVRGLWGNCRIQTYGSFESETYLPKSDIDLCVFLKTTKNSARLVMELGSYLRRDDNFEKNKFENIRVVSNARVPIVKFVDEETCVNIDISFNSLQGKENSKLTKRLLSSFPALRPLLFVLKHFLAIHSLDEPYFGGLSTYTLILLITSHLQLHPSRQTQSRIVNLGTLLIDFFKVYSQFNFINTGISVNGKGRYFNKILMCVFDIKKPTTFYVQDPIQTKNNAARSSYDILKFLKSCLYANQNLTKNYCLGSIFKTNFMHVQSSDPILNQKLISFWHLKNYFVRSPFEKRRRLNHENPNNMRNSNQNKRYDQNEYRNRNNYNYNGQRNQKNSQNYNKANFHHNLYDNNTNNNFDLNNYDNQNIHNNYNNTYQINYENKSNNDLPPENSSSSSRSRSRGLNNNFHYNHNSNNNYELNSYDKKGNNNNYNNNYQINYENKSNSDLHSKNNSNNNNSNLINNYDHNSSNNYHLNTSDNQNIHNNYNYSYQINYENKSKNDLHINNSSRRSRSRSLGNNYRYNHNSNNNYELTSYNKKGNNNNYNNNYQINYENKSYNNLHSKNNYNNNNSNLNNNYHDNPNFNNNFLKQNFESRKRNFFVQRSNNEKHITKFY